MNGNEPVSPSAWQLAESFRRTVLFILSVTAMGMGALLGLTAPEQGPSFDIFGQLPGWPLPYGALLLTFGAVQFFGVWRNWRFLSVAGCALANLWYLAFALTFVVTWFVWGAGPRTDPNPSIYPLAPYLGYSALHLAAVTGLYHHWRASRGSVGERPDGLTYDMAAAHGER